MHEGVDAPLGLFPHFFAQRKVALYTIAVVELIGPIGMRSTTDPFGRGNHLHDQLLRDPTTVTRNEGEVCSERSHLRELFFAERVRRDDLQRIALCRAHQSQRGAGTPAGVFDHGVARLEATVLLRLTDHRERDAILHAARGILSLDLDDDPPAVRRHDPTKLHKRRVSDRRQDVRAHMHARRSSISWYIPFSREMCAYTRTVGKDVLAARLPHSVSMLPCA